MDSDEPVDSEFGESIDIPFIGLSTKAKAKSLYEDIQEADENHGYWENKLFLYTMLANLSLEEMSVELLALELVDPERNEENAKTYFSKKVRQSQREELLYQTGVIDTGLKGEMNQAKKFRDDLIHGNTTVSEIYSTNQEVPPEVEKIKIAIEKLERKLEE